jgi:hypothetical protein
MEVDGEDEAFTPMYIVKTVNEVIQDVSKRQKIGAYQGILEDGYLRKSAMGTEEEQRAKGYHDPGNSSGSLFFLCLFEDTKCAAYELVSNKEKLRKLWNKLKVSKYNEIKSAEGIGNMCVNVIESSAAQGPWVRS